MEGAIVARPSKATTAKEEEEEEEKEEEEEEEEEEEDSGRKKEEVERFPGEKCTRNCIGMAYRGALISVMRG